MFIRLKTTARSVLYLGRLAVITSVSPFYVMNSQS